MKEAWDRWNEAGDQCRRQLKPLFSMPTATVNGALAKLKLIHKIGDVYERDIEEWELDVGRALTLFVQDDLERLAGGAS